MVKNLFLVIFISILIIGCDNQYIVEPELWELEEETENTEVDYFLVLESY